MLFFIILKDMNKAKIRILINYENEINIINLVYVVKLDFLIQKTNINAPKIDGLILKIYSKIITIFQVFDKLYCLRFF